MADAQAEHRLGACGEGERQHGAVPVASGILHLSCRWWKVLLINLVTNSSSPVGPLLVAVPNSEGPEIQRKGEPADPEDPGCRWVAMPSLGVFCYLQLHVQDCR